MTNSHHDPLEIQCVQFKVGKCLPSPCFIRTVTCPIFHWYSWCLRLSHLFTFPCQLWSTHQLWKFMGMFGDHRDSLYYQGEPVDQARVLSLYLLNYLSRFILWSGLVRTYCNTGLCARSYCTGTSAVGGHLTPTSSSIRCVVIHSALHYFTVITGLEQSRTWSVLQVVIILHTHT